jgi:hypothetical protein
MGFHLVRRLGGHLKEITRLYETGTTFRRVLLTSQQNKYLVVAAVRLAFSAGSNLTSRNVFFLSDKKLAL